MNKQEEFSKRSRRAILIFVALFLVVVLIPRAIVLFQKPSKFVFNQTDFEKKIFKKKEYKKYQYENYSYSKKSKFKTPPAKFDPNKYSPSDWMNLGMSQKQADLIIKFGKRGFYSHEDLKKVFVISEKFFEVIKDSLVYPEKTQKVVEKFEYKKQEHKVIDLNSASMEELISIPGIGEGFAKGIIKKRDALGGFISKNQLLEVWKFDQEKLTSIEEYIKVDPTTIRQIELNSVTIEELKLHPYFTWNIANSIVKLRTQMGGFQKIEDIKRSVLINDELFNKIKPYLTL
jgi:competence protein ComEA